MTTDPYEDEGFCKFNDEVDTCPHCQQHLGPKLAPEQMLSHYRLECVQDCSCTGAAQ